MSDNETPNLFGMPIVSKSFLTDAPPGGSQILVVSPLTHSIKLDLSTAEVVNGGDNVRFTIKLDPRTFQAIDMIMSNLKPSDPEDEPRA